MDERLTSDELRSLLGAFALGAVDADEREQVEQFVLDNRDARAELHQLEHAVAWLGHASPRPSAESWDAVRNEIDRDSSTGAASVTEIASARSHRGGLWRRVTAVAAAAAMVIGVSVAVAEVIDSDSTTTARATTIVLRSPDGAAAVELRVDPDGIGTITESALLAAPAGHVYQLWAQEDPDSPMHSAGLLGPNPAAGRRLRVPDHSARVAISIEPDGGSPEPTTEPVAIATLGPV